MWVFGVIIIILNIGGLPSIEDQKEWIVDNIINFDPMDYFAAVMIQPFADNLANYMGVLPKENDFDGSNNKDLWEKIQNGRMFGEYYRIVGHGKYDNAINVLIKHLNTDVTETIENQALVTRLNPDQLKTVYQYKEEEDKILHPR